MKTEIFHSVNEGLYIENQGISILIDGIHDGISVGQSNMPQDLEEELETGTGIFRHIDCLLFTHLHIDHFSRKKVSVYMEKRDAALYGPGLKESNLLFDKIDDEVSFCQLHHISIWSIKTVHDGERFACVPHVIYVLEVDDEVFIIGGDGILTKEIADKIKRIVGNQVAAIFVNVFQLMEEEKNGFIRSLSPGKVFLYHMPFPKDDVNNMKYVKKAALRSYGEDLPEITELTHMSWLDRIQTVKFQSAMGDSMNVSKAASGL